MAKELLDREMEEEKAIRTVLEEDIKFTGTMKFTSSLKIKGGFEGEIDSTGHLVVGKNAFIKANIKAGKITIYGKIKGNLEVSEKVEILSGAAVEGDIKTPDLVIQSGCRFNGNCIMTPKEKVAASTTHARDDSKKK
ncbi:MAG: polymer-forming cytoskeletal protein [Spirochaetes bacterium]|nr:polymer-forming cytoskeletal protein [Spirochaetota bacterium]